MKHKKPPVVEAWIQFKVSLAEETAGWDESTAKEFINKYFPEFKQQELFGLAEVKIDPRTANVLGTVKSFERIRAFTQARDLCVQAGRNLLVFNQIRQGEWGGYDRLQDGAFDALEKYFGFRGLSTLAGVSLHYRDIVVIPSGPNGKIQLDDYFAVCPRIPETAFGEVSGFRVAMDFPHACENGITTVAIQTVPVIESSCDEYRFAVDWHVGCDGKTPDVASARQWLEQAHRDLRGVFKAAFTKRTLDLFEPEGI
jgi:uncharacterized protein (TIGR04255 family)